MRQPLPHLPDPWLGPKRPQALCWELSTGGFSHEGGGEDAARLPWYLSCVHVCDPEAERGRGLPPPDWFDFTVGQCIAPQLPEPACIPACNGHRPRGSVCCKYPLGLGKDVCSQPPGWARSGRGGRVLESNGPAPPGQTGWAPPWPPRSAGRPPWQRAGCASSRGCRRRSPRLPGSAGVS